MMLRPQRAQDAPVQQAAVARAPVAGKDGMSASGVVVATSADLGLTGVIHAQVMPWPGQRAVLSVCLRGAYAAAASRPCRYEADFTASARGQAVVLRNLAFTDGPVAPHVMRTLSLTDLRPRKDVLAGPVRAQVVRVTDGDTVQVLAETLPGHFVATDIRLAGIDTPEKGGHAKCADEAARAGRAAEATRALLQGRQVMLSDIAFEKYGGRMLGRLRTQAGVDAAQSLVAQGLAHAYDGGTKQGWCAARPR